MAVVRPGLVLYEISGVDREMAKEAMRLAAHKLPIPTKFVEKEHRRGQLRRSMKAADLRDLTVEELKAKLKEISEELFNLNFQHAYNNWITPAGWGARKDMARVKTVLRDKAEDRSRKSPLGEIKKKQLLSHGRLGKYGEKRGVRKTRIGMVVSDKMDKTVVVEVKRLVSHPLYHKIIRRRNRIKAHDPKNPAKWATRCS